MRMFFSAPMVLFVCYWTCCLGAGWRDKKADIYFVMDSSTAMFRRNFQLQTDLVNQLVRDMDIGPDKTRVGMGIYSKTFQNYIPLGNGYNKRKLLWKISNAPQNRGHMVMSTALEGLRRHLDSSVTRPNVPRIAVFFTASKSQYPTLAYDSATRAKKDGIFMFVVGIGRRVSHSELLDIASDPKRDFLYHAEHYAYLSELLPDLSSNMAEVRLYQNDKGTCGETERVDTVFVFDEYAMGVPLVASVKRFLSSIADDLRMNAGNIRIGVVSKTCANGRDIQLGDYMTREEFKRAIEQNTRESGLSSLIRDARQTYFDTETGHRDGALKRLVVIMANPVRPEHLSTFKEQMIRALHEDNMEVFIIRHGSDYDKRLLQRYASHVLYTDIDQAKDPFLRLFCKAI